MIGFLSIIAIGFFLGMRHATDPDHVIAVTTIVSRQNKISRAALTGVFWGVGHTLTILVVGTAIILFGVVIPARIGLTMEFSVAIMLLVLGVMNVAAFMRAAGAMAKVEHAAAAVHTHHHSHGDYVHTHAHGHAPESHPHSPDGTPVARMDRYFGSGTIYRQLRPLLVGIVHGLAGSAAVALLVLTTIHDPRWAIAYLLVFGLGTIAGMMVITMLLGVPFAYTGRFANFNRGLAVASGLISVAFGLFITYQIGLVDGLFTAHPT